MQIYTVMLLTRDLRGSCEGGVAVKNNTSKRGRNCIITALLTLASNLVKCPPERKF